MADGETLTMASDQAPKGQASSSEALSAGLECVIGRVQFALPVDAVHQVAEYEVAPPPPLASPWVGGLGLYSGRVLVSISLLSRRVGPAPARRSAKGVLLNTPGSEVYWALEVGSVASFVKAKVLSKGVQVGQAKLPAWVTAAVADDGRSLGWIHAEQMMQELSGQEPARG